MSNTSGSNKKSVSLTLIGKSFNLVFNLFFLALLSWMMLLLLTALGVLCWGWQAVWVFFEKAISGMTSHLWVTQLGLENMLNNTDHVMQLPSSFAWLFPTDAIPIARLVHSSVNAWVTFLLVTQFVIQRCQIFITGFLGIVAFALLGFIDGLVQRDIRKFQNSRESTLVFHRSKNFLANTFFMGYFCFIASPFDLNLSLYLIIMAVTIGCLIQISITKFKKHL